MKVVGNISVLVFVVSSVLGVGLGLTVTQIVAPLGRVRLVAMTLLANFVIVPFIAVCMTHLLRLSEPYAVGLILLGSAAGAPFLPKVLELTKGDLAHSVTLMVLLMVASLAYMPLALPRLLPGVAVDSLKIAWSLSITMIMPLMMGLGLKARWPLVAARLRPALNGVSQISLLLALVLISALNFSSLLELAATRALPALAMFIGIAFAIGYGMGGPAAREREVLGFATCARNLPAALLVAGQNFTDPRVAVTVIVFSLLSVVIFIPLVKVFGRRNSTT